MTRMMAPPDESSQQRSPRYEDEDTSFTTRRELMGWYSYGLAAEVFAVCGVGSFLPVTLEQLARESGVLWSDHSVPCVNRSTAGNGTNTVSPGPALFSRAASNRDPTQCVVFPFGGEVTTASFAMYTFSAAVFVQALCLISFSAFADHGNSRKQLLLAFSFTGAVSAMLFIVVIPRLYLLGSLLVIVGVTCLGSSYVIANSFLPLLVANDPLVGTHIDRSKQESSEIPLENLDTISSQNHVSTANGHLPDPLPGKASFQEKVSPAMQLSTKISSTGVGIGYCSAVFVQLLSIALLFVLRKLLPNASQDLPLRLVLLLVGSWWLIFTFPVAFWLRNRPGPPLALARYTSKIRIYLGYVTFAWTSLFRTIRTAFKLRQVIIFLISWFILSDAIATISGTAILFARIELHMSTVAVAVISIIATSSGIVGAFTWPILSRRFALRTNHTIIACIMLMEIIPVYGLLGYLPFIKAWGVGGLQQSWEIYPLAFIHGMVMGGLSSYCRSFYGLLIPPGYEAAFYALYAVTDKGSSAVGPAIVGVLVDVTGSIRPAFIFLAVLIVLPVPLIWSVNVEKGQEDALRIAGFKGKDIGEEIHGEDTVEAEGLLDEDENLQK